MSTPDPTSSKKAPGPGFLLGMGAVFIALGVVFMTTLQNSPGTVASTLFMVAGGIFMGLGAVRLLKARR